MNVTTIEWTGMTVNPFRARARQQRGNTRGVGHYCEKVSRGCTNCFSSQKQPRFGLPVFQQQRGADMPEVFLEPKVLNQVLKRRKPTKIFWCDMTDMFGSWIPFEWIAACFGVMAATPQHTHQVLTKRPARALEFFAWLAGAAERCAWSAHTAMTGNVVQMSPRLVAARAQPWPLPNVHLGVSCEDQATFDERIPLLLECPAALHWLSAEPLLERIDVRNFLRPTLDRPALKWVVIGGESGPRARDCSLESVESLVSQCRLYGVPPFVKQLGRHVTSTQVIVGTKRLLAATSPPMYLTLKHKKGGDPSEWPEELRVRETAG